MEPQLNEEYLKYKEISERLKKERDTLTAEMNSLINTVPLTHKQKKLAQEYLEGKADNNSLFSYILPNSRLAVKMRYWSIHKCFIKPHLAYIDKLVNLDKKILDVDRLMFLFSKPPSDEAVAIWEKYKNTEITVEIDYGINPGDCGDCTD